MELNREQIIKDLECCAKDDCDNCPNDFGNCYSNLAGYALALIKEQVEQIFKLENRLKECENGYEGTLFLESCKLHDAEQTVKELTEENENASEKNKWLNEENERIGIENFNLICQLSRIKEDTVRKMHSEIKERCIKGGIYPAFVANVIEQVAKEMLEGNNGFK